MRELPLLNLRNNSVFAPYEADFVAQKRALGCKYNAAVEVLNLFDDFCVEHGLSEPVLDEQLYNSWCRKKPSENDTTHYMRVQYINMFSKFLSDNGISAPTAFYPLPRKSKTFVPYIFTMDEISQLFNAIDQANVLPAHGSPIRHLVHPVLFRTLYGCGLRVSEAARLKKADIDLDTGTVIIRMAKGGKDRMVVLSDSLLRACRDYRTHPEIVGFESEYFFPARNHGFYDDSSLYADFRKYLHLSGIPHRGRGNGPRMHDLRHTFAVHVLNSWAAQGKDLYTCLPILQQYLGHASITSTEKYLQLVPSAYNQVTGTFEAKFPGLFPEVPNETE